MKISTIKTLEILDSKGTPTLEVTVQLENGITATAGVPSGASTGIHEAHELRDQDPNRYAGKGVQKAVVNVNDILAKIVIGQAVENQQQIDQLMIAADGTENKSKLGGNAILGVSMAVCKAAAKAQQIELYEYFGQLSNQHTFALPQPMILILEGGKHGNWATDIQEFMIVPKNEAFITFAEKLRVGATIFQVLEKVLQQKKYSTGVGFEGAFAPQEISSNDEALALITQAVRQAGFNMGSQIVMAIDTAAAEFYQNNIYTLKSENNTTLSATDWATRLKTIIDKYQLWSIEDPFDQESWTDWATFLKNNPQIQLVGDDLLTTNVKRIQQGIDTQAMNSVLIKPNQIGTISETLQSIKLAKNAGLTTIISHRGGETDDDLIADLAVGTNAGQCKFGGPNRGERLAKYNRLLEIEAKLI